MADVEVLINGIILVHGQGVKESTETSTSKIVCFDEVLTDGSDKVSYKLDIDRLVFETRDQYEELRDTLQDMIHIPGDIQTRETIRYKGEDPFTIVKNYSGAILDANDYEMKPEERSAQKLSFICGTKEEYCE